jgi:hypothetical protein
MNPIRWIRTPLIAGGRRATLLTSIAVILTVLGPLLLPVEPGLRLRITLSGVGIVSLLLGLLRPPLFWEGSIMEGWRWALGDRGVALIYAALGLGLLVAPWSSSYVL